MILYSCKSSFEQPDSYIITKFDDDLNVESSYTTNLYSCDCPAGVRPSCRHRLMLPHFLAQARQDTDWFFCYDDQTWHQPFEGMDANDDPEVGADAASRVPAPTGEVVIAPASPTSFKRRV